MKLLASKFNEKNFFLRSQAVRTGVRAYMDATLLAACMGRKVQPQTQSSKCHLCIYPTCFSKSNIILFRNCDIACCEIQTGDMGTPL